MTKIIDVSGKGAEISASENDANLDSLSGINSPITATSHTIDVDDQNDTIEYLNASPIAVTLPAISTVSGANINTSDFTVTLKNVGAGAVTVTRGGTDTFEDASTEITLNQYDCVTIQTDSTLGKWNIIDKYEVDFATKTGAETLTNKTLTAPIIDEINDANGNESIVIVSTGSAVNQIDITNSATGFPPRITATGDDTNLNLELNGKGTGRLSTKSTLVYGMVILDTPEQLITSNATKGSWTTFDSLTLANAGAVTAILRVYVNGGLTAADGEIFCYLRKTGSAVAAGDLTRVAAARDREAASTALGLTATGESVVNLDSNNDFDWYSDTSGAGSVVTDVVLVGYYV